MGDGNDATITFEQIMDAFPRNRDAYESLVRTYRRDRNAIVPFVGAGLSMPEYPGWSRVLSDIASKLSSKDAKDNVHKDLAANRFLSAAQRIADAYGDGGELVLAKDVAAAFPESTAINLRNDNREQWNRKPLVLLPMLFPDGAITTNYDRELLLTYREDAGNTHIEEITPWSHQGSTFRKFLDRQLSAVVKVHGTVVSDDAGAGLDASDLVLTRHQYDEKYGKPGNLNGPVACALGEAAARSMLFLGCSLTRPKPDKEDTKSKKNKKSKKEESDRTLELFAKTYRRGHDHYAIVAAPRDSSDVDPYARWLSKLGIQPILYPPGEYDSVRIVLEQLLHDVDPAAYDALPVHVGMPDTHASAPDASMLNARFVQGPHTFVGRGKELDALRRFCESGEQFAWWGVVGPGGMGKTRLANELCNRLRSGVWPKHADGDEQETFNPWTAVELRRSDCASATTIENAVTTTVHSYPSARPVLIVIDYALAHADAIAQWMREHGDDEHPQRRRVLLLERSATPVDSDERDERHGAAGNRTQQFSADGANATSLIAAMLKNDDGKVGRLLWRSGTASPAQSGDDALLQLGPLHSADLDELIRAFVHEYYPQHAAPTSADCANLRAVLSRIDPKAERPLIAMFIADAWANGDDPTHWSMSETHEYVRKRDNRMLNEALHQQFGSSNSAAVDVNDFDSDGLWINLLRWSATMLGGLPFDEARALVFADDDDDSAEAWEALFGGRPREFKRKLKACGLADADRVLPIRPDLVGEYAMLCGLTQLAAVDRALADAFMTRLWTGAWSGEHRIAQLNALVSFVRHAAQDFGDAQGFGATTGTDAAWDALIPRAVFDAARNDDALVIAVAMCVRETTALLTVRSRPTLVRTCEQWAAMLMRLVANHAPASRALYGDALNNLALLRRAQRRYEQAKQEYQEALSIYRQLAKTSPNDYQHGLAAALNNLAVLHYDLQQYEQAEQEYREALSIYRQLAQANPSAYQPNVAMTLNNLAVLHHDLHQHEQAEQEYQEALLIRRQLAQANPDVYRPNLATTLNNLAVLHRDLHQHEQAEQECQEALGIYRQLAQANPSAYQPNVAMTLNNLAVLHHDLHQHEQAEQEYQEALSIYNQLAKASPSTYQPSVALTLYNLAVLHTDLHQHEQAIQEYQEALTIFCALMQQSPAAYRQYFQSTLENAIANCHDQWHDAASHASREQLRDPMIARFEQLARHCNEVLEHTILDDAQRSAVERCAEGCMLFVHLLRGGGDLPDPRESDDAQ